MPDNIEEGKIARIVKIAFRRAHADGFPALPMQVAPIAPQRRGRGDAQRISAGNLLALCNEPQLEIAGRVDHEIVGQARAVPVFHRKALRQSADRPRRHKRHRLLGIGGRVAPRILGDDRKPERLAHDGERRPDRLPVCRLPWHEREGRLLGELGEFVGGESIDRRPELDPCFAVGLQPVARRALPAIAHARGERIARAQIAAADTDQQGIGIGPDVEPVEPHLELGAVARLDGGEVGRGGPVELRLAHVGGGPPRDFHHAGVIDPEGARGIGQDQLGIGARDKWPRRRKRHRAHVLGQIAGERHARTSIAASLLVEG